MKTFCISGLFSSKNGKEDYEKFPQSFTTGKNNSYNKMFKLVLAICILSQLYYGKFLVLILAQILKWNRFSKERENKYKILVFKWAK